MKKDIENSDVKVLIEQLTELDEVISKGYKHLYAGYKKSFLDNFNINKDNSEVMVSFINVAKEEKLLDTLMSLNLNFPKEFNEFFKEKVKNNVSFLNPFSSNSKKFKEISSLIKSQELEVAEILAKEWIKEDISNSESWRIAALVYMEKKEYSNALTSVDFAKVYEKSTDPRNSLLESQIYIKTQEYDKANTVYNEMLKTFNKPEFNFIFASVLVQKAELSIITKKSPELNLEMIHNFIDNNPGCLNALQLEKVVSIEQDIENNNKTKKLKNK